MRTKSFLSFVRATHVHCDCIVFTCNPLQIGIRSAIGMAQMDLPLPEITKEGFLCAWTHFELVAAAKEGNAAKKSYSASYIVAWYTCRYVSSSN